MKKVEKEVTQHRHKQYLIVLTLTEEILFLNI